MILRYLRKTKLSSSTLRPHREEIKSDREERSEGEGEGEGDAMFLLLS
jgi:hypothetical protein